MRMWCAIARRSQAAVEAEEEEEMDDKEVTEQALWMGSGHRSTSITGQGTQYQHCSNTAQTHVESHRGTLARASERERGQACVRETQRARARKRVPLWIN